MMTSEMTPHNVGELAERRRNRQKLWMIGLALFVALLQLGVAFLRVNSPEGTIPAWMTVLLAAAVGGFMFLLFRFGDHISDEFKQRQVSLVATNIMKTVFIGYPAWLLLEQGDLVPPMGATALFGVMAGVMFLTLIWTRLRG